MLHNGLKWKKLFRTPPNNCRNGLASLLDFDTALAIFRDRTSNLAS